MRVALCALAMLGGCFPVWLADEDPDPPPVAPSTPPFAGPPPSAPPPSVDLIDVPSWPPLGPLSQATIAVSASAGLASIEIAFANSITQTLSGTVGVVAISGEELGEGLGSLRVTIRDVLGGAVARQLPDVLVDLSPPVVTLGRTVLGADDTFEAWIADEWILGGAELYFQAAMASVELGQGKPPTLGASFDQALVAFPTAELPAGRGEATLVVRDAAGNWIAEQFELVIDGTPPTVKILAPAPGTEVAGPFTVSLELDDPGGGPAWADVRLDGTSAATVIGPKASITLDASGHAPGPLLVEAVAVDEAGNESAPAQVPLVVK